MCGISGVFKLGESAKLYEERLQSSITQRGPDGFGEWLSPDRNIHLYHSRLSIIDLSDHAAQPMVDSDSEWVISYNGEIFNYVEIREELRALGCIFRSASDTEVLLKAWAQWGLDALPRLNGMFAFAVVHRRSGEMWLVRDRFGVKPLLWGRSHCGGLIFSSSLAAVAQSIGASVDTSYCAFGLRYKAFEMPEGYTAFQGVASLPAGGWLHVVASSAGVLVKQGKWYELKHAVTKKIESIFSMSDADLLDQCRQLLWEAVHLRLRSDVPIAVSLSGGLDSSTVAATASKVVSDMHGFTYGATDAAMSEGPIVARFAKQIGITPHFIWPKFIATDLDALLERTLKCQEAPFPGMSVMAQNEVFRNVREAGFKVLLGGQGGDEIFGGYRKFFVVAARYSMARWDVVESARLIHSLGLMLLHEAGAVSVYWGALSRYGTKKNECFTLLDWLPESANLWGAAGSNLTDRQIEDVQRWSIPTLLRYEDRNSMGHGVESRLPFMDYRLVELALALPSRLKIRNGYGKWAVRHVTEGIVPDYIRMNRKKRGFDVTQSWIEDGLGESLRERIYSNQSVLAPYLKLGVDLNKHLSNVALKSSGNLLDEALMLAWLAKPIRESVMSGGIK